jgi:peptidoglycan hydrolase-like protein with peptidoglycan-binding domain
MGLDVSPQTEARIRQEAQRQGVSVDALLERLMNEQAAGTAVRAYQAPELPVLHLGPMGPLRRRDIYDDALRRPPLADARFVGYYEPDEQDDCNHLSKRAH